MSAIKASAIAGSIDAFCVPALHVSKPILVASLGFVGIHSAPTVRAHVRRLAGDLHWLLAVRFRLHLL
jgi:hypothetical protein